MNNVCWCGSMMSAHAPDAHGFVRVKHGLNVPPPAIPVRRETVTVCYGPGVFAELRNPTARKGRDETNP